MSAKPRSGSSILFNLVQNCSTSFFCFEFRGAKVVIFLICAKKIAEKAIFSLSRFYPLLFLELFAG